MYTISDKLNKIKAVRNVFGHINRRAACLIKTTHGGRERERERLNEVMGLKVKVIGHVVFPFTPRRRMGKQRNSFTHLQH